MKTKLLVLTTWLFVYVALRTSDDVWLFLAAYSGVLTACTSLNGMDTSRYQSKKTK